MMPLFYDTTGRQVDAATATFPDGRCKPGYRQTLADGESAGFAMAFTDSAPAVQTDAAAEYAADRLKREAAIRDGWRGTSEAPPPLTSDAKADYEANRAARKVAISNAWRG